MMGSIGVTVALIGWALFFAIEQLARAKYHAVRCGQTSLPCTSGCEVRLELKHLVAAHSRAPSCPLCPGRLRSCFLSVCSAPIACICARTLTRPHKVTVSLVALLPVHLHAHGVVLEVLLLGMGC